MSEYTDIFIQATKSLLSEKKIAIDGDVYIYTGNYKPEQQPPQKPQKPPKNPPTLPEFPPIPPDVKLTKDLIDIIVENSNLISLANFIGYSIPEAINIIYKETNYISKVIPPEAAARVDANNNVEINVDTFNYILKNHNNPNKPIKYWYSIYVISHELVHVLTNCVHPDEISASLAEAFVPIIQYEFYANYNGAPNPHLIDIAESGFERMSQKRKGLMRVGYPPHTFYFFDQLSGFNFLDHKLFLKTISDYAKAPRPSADKLTAIRKTFPILTE